MKIYSVPIKDYYIPAEQHELDGTISDFEGVTFSVCDRGRTICDCFKYHTRLGNETISKMRDAYVIDGKKIYIISQICKRDANFKKINDYRSDTQYRI